MHNVLVAQNESPVSATLIPDDVDTRLYYANIADLEFGIQGCLENNFPFQPNRLGQINVKLSIET